MTERVAALHEVLLNEALTWRAKHPEFRFNLRRGEITNQNRLSQGFWFSGGKAYVLFAPFEPNNGPTRTRTIGLLVRVDVHGVPRRCELIVVYDGQTHEGSRRVHDAIVDALGLATHGRNKRYERPYPTRDPAEAFRMFVEEDYPRICTIIAEHGEDDFFLIKPGAFDEMIARVNVVRNASVPSVPGPTAVALNPARRPRNIIYFGPPGTGKTYRLQQLRAAYTDAPGTVDADHWTQGIVAEYGWRPVLVAALADLGGTARVPAIREHAWVRAKSRERGRTGPVDQTVWGYLSEHTPEDVATVKTAVRRAPFVFTKRPDSTWELLPEWRDADAEAGALLDRLRAGQGASTQAVQRYRMVTFHPSYGYEDFVRGIRPVEDEQGNTQFRVVEGPLKRICDVARGDPTRRYALLIDEINRANLAKVFGELITLLEPDKRAVYDDAGRLTRGVVVQLPGGRGDDIEEEPFGVPANLDIYGTMNTADRSIALLDVALRRRFRFVEMAPDTRRIDREVEGVHLGKLLARLNDRLEYLLDRDHRIGHAYLMPVRSLDGLRRVFRRQLLPLLQEYFFDDLARVAMTLAVSPQVPAFIDAQRLAPNALFPASVHDRAIDERFRYAVTNASTWTAASFRSLYDPAGSAGNVA